MAASVVCVSLLFVFTYFRARLVAFPLWFWIARHLRAAHRLARNKHAYISRSTEQHTTNDWIVFELNYLFPRSRRGVWPSSALVVRTELRTR